MFKLVVLALMAVAAQAAINPSNCGQPPIAPGECNTGCTKTQSDMVKEFYRIVGGMAARQGSWPWQVQIKVFGSQYCGGSIIDSNTVVTAAHCFDQYQTPSYFKVHAGSHRKSSTDTTEKVHSVRSITRHSRYDSAKIDNDIAVVKVSTDFVWSNYIRPVCVASGSTASDGSYVFVTGFGNTQGTGNDSVLKQTMVPIVGHSTCNSAYSGRITNNMICAGYTSGGHDACQGDSGGPLVQKSGTRWYLYGITSWGIGCAQSAYPGVYTKVVNYYNWISQNM